MFQNSQSKVCIFRHEQSEESHEKWASEKEKQRQRKVAPVLRTSNSNSNAANWEGKQKTEPTVLKILPLTRKINFVISSIKHHLASYFPPGRTSQKHLVKIYVLLLFLWSLDVFQIITKLRLIWKCTSHQVLTTSVGMQKCSTEITAGKKIGQIVPWGHMCLCWHKCLKTHCRLYFCCRDRIQTSTSNLSKIFCLTWTKETLLDFQFSLESQNYMITKHCSLEDFV